MLDNTEDKYVGTWILGQYRIERLLDSGGMGTVYLAEQASMDRFAAVKILHSVAKTDEKQGRFRTEARYMAPEQWQCHTITDRVDQYTQDLRSISLKGEQPPPRCCTDCQEELEFDELPEVYFSFLEQR